MFLTPSAIRRAQLMADTWRTAPFLLTAPLKDLSGRLAWCETGSLFIISDEIREPFNSGKIIFHNFSVPGAFFGY